VVKSATDDTGRNLLDSEQAEARFEEVRSSSRAGAATVKLKLRNPARKAATLKEVRGEVQLFVPKNDPQAGVFVRDVMQQSGKMVESPALKASGIEVMPLNKTDYDERKAKQKENKGAITGAIENAFGGLFGGFATMNDNSLALLVRDPDGKLVNVEFEDADGKKVRSNSRMTSGERNAQTRIYEFNSKPPRTIILQVLTPKALVSSPFDLKDVPLP